MQKEISAWHRKTFPDAELEDIFSKAHEEIIELTWELADTKRFDPELIACEFADVFIVMSALLDRIGVNVDAAIKYKMTVNKNRGESNRWNEKGEKKHGCYCDLEPGEKPDGCVIDESVRSDCVLASRGIEKEDCEYWRVIE